MIFVDTSFLLAFTDKKDIHHYKAAGLFDEALRSGDGLILHNYVVVESIALFDRRLGREAAKDLIDTIKRFTTHWITTEEHIAAEEEFSKQKSKKVSFVDTVSFIFMRSRGIKQFLAFDSDFDKEGFKMFGWKIH